MCRDSSRQAGAEIGVTDAMVDAAALELCNYDPDFDKPDDAARRILVAALGNEPLPLHEGEHVRADMMDFVSDLCEAINRHWFVNYS